MKGWFFHQFNMAEETRNPVAELISFLKKEKKYDRLKTFHGRLKSERTLPELLYNELYQAYQTRGEVYYFFLRLKHRLLCESCQHQLEPIKNDGETVFH